MKVLSKLEAGTDAIAEIRSYSIEESADTLETTSMGDAARTHLASLTSFSGSVDVYWDETDTAQTALTVGATVTIKFYPEGTASSGKVLYRRSYCNWCFKKCEF